MHLPSALPSIRRRTNDALTGIQPSSSSLHCNELSLGTKAVGGEQLFTQLVNTCVSCVGNFVEVGSLASGPLGGSILVESRMSPLQRYNVRFLATPSTNLNEFDWPLESVSNSTKFVEIEHLNEKPPQKEKTKN